MARALRSRNCVSTRVATKDSANTVPDQFEFACVAGPARGATVRIQSVRVSILIGVIAAALVALVGYRWPPDPEPPAVTVAPVAASPRVEREAVAGFVGSATCAECHAAEYERWAPSGHAISIAPFSDSFAAQPFDGSYFVARDIEHRMGPGGSITCEGPGGEMQAFAIDTIVGVRRIQMFTTRMPGGRIQVLPVMLEVPKKRWFDYSHFIFGGPSQFDIPPDSPNSWYTFARNYNSRCLRCHATDPKIGYDADAGTYESRWSEAAVGCEACHGEGGAHVTRWRRLDDEAPDGIVNSARLSIERANMVCGSCHAESFMVQPGYKPGDDLWAFMDANGLEDRKHLHPDGRARELIHNLLPIMTSPCGPLSCSLCHDPHGSSHSGDLRRPLTDDMACTSCHAEIAAALTAHTHHKASSLGSRCVSCHMPRMVIEGGHGWTHDHTISIPSIVNNQELGLPNACASCHVLEDKGWEYESFRRWYPDADKRNHRVALAASIAKGTGLEELAKDSNEIYRAGAVRLLAGRGVDLAAHLDDASPLVRRAAIEGVKRTDPSRLVPLLDDENHVLRYRAALALAERAARADPDLRRRVIAVLKAFAAQRSDVDATHYALAVLFDLSDEPAQAVASYQRYLRLNPWDQRARQRMEWLRGDNR